MTRSEYLRLCDSEYFTALLKKHKWNVRAAAIEAGASRASVYRILHRLGLLAPRPRLGGNSEWRALQ